MPGVNRGAAGPKVALKLHARGQRARSRRTLSLGPIHPGSREHRRLERLTGGRGFAFR